MSSLLIVGAGSFSPEVEELARILGYTDLAFLDDRPETAMSAPVVGGVGDIAALRHRFDTAIVALGSNATRLRCHRLLKSSGYRVPTLIHPTAYISPGAALGDGCIVRAHAVVSSHVRLGEATILNVGALIDHHVEIGEGCHILMGAVVRNMAKVPPLTRVESLHLVQ